jgi:hypothetical protein
MKKEGAIMRLKVEKAADFKIVWWDWKEAPPHKQLARCAKKYKHTYATDLGTDGHYVFFSNFAIRNDDKAEELLRSA